MPRTNQAYPPEFRREAIRLVRASDEEHPIPRIAREIGVSYGTLRSWVNQDEIDSGHSEKGSQRRRRMSSAGSDVR